MAQNRMFHQYANQEESYNAVLVALYDLTQVNNDAFANKEQDIINQIDNYLDLAKLAKVDRIYLIDSAIKTGSIAIVTYISEKLITLGFMDDVRKPYELNREYPGRPTFWLAAIVTRQSNVPVENYELIEKYLCEKFNAPALIWINGDPINRHDYLYIISEWKTAENQRLIQNGRTGNRYT